MAGVVVALGVVGTGCLSEGRPVDGRLLHPGREIESPGLVNVGGTLMVTYAMRGAEPAPGSGLSPRYDLWRAPFAGGSGPRRLVAGISEREGWGGDADTAGFRYFMVDERLLDGADAGGPLAAATLVRADLENGVVDQIPDVSSFTVSRRRGTTELVYRRPLLSSRLAELRFRRYDGAEPPMDRPLGPLSGGVQFVGPARVYFVIGEDRTLARITSADGPVEPLRSHVTRFMVSENERWVALQVMEEGRRTPLNLLFDPREGAERELPGDNICCWASFSGRLFMYSEAPLGGTPARFHLYDTETGDDEVVVLPPGMDNVTRVNRRPGSSSDMLLSDNEGRAALFRQGDGGWTRALAGISGGAVFTEDGRHVIYIDQVRPPEGRLMVQDADMERPPRQLSPVEALASPYFHFLADGPRRILVYTARYGRGVGDLYYANHETGESRLMAEAIMQYIARPWHMIGVVRTSEQDLVGELVHKDLTRDDEVVLAHRVAEVSILEGNDQVRAAYVLRERTATARDGLWAVGD